MQDWQYFHQTQAFLQHDQKFTFCIDMPSKEFFYKFLTPFGGKVFGTTVGLARLHPSDNYVKKVGRAVAVQNSEACRFEITSVNFTQDTNNPDRNEAILACKDTLNRYSITVILKSKQERPQLAYAYLNTRGIE